MQASRPAHWRLTTLHTASLATIIWWSTTVRELMWVRCAVTWSTVNTCAMLFLPTGLSLHNHSHCMLNRSLHRNQMSTLTRSLQIQFSPVCHCWVGLSVLPTCQLVICCGAGVWLSYMYWMMSILVSGTYRCTCTVNSAVAVNVLSKLDNMVAGSEKFVTKTKNTLQLPCLSISLTLHCRDVRYKFTITYSTYLLTTKHLIP